MNYPHEWAALPTNAIGPRWEACERCHCLRHESAHGDLVERPDRRDEECPARLRAALDVALSDAREAHRTLGAYDVVTNALPVDVRLIVINAHPDAYNGATREALAAKLGAAFDGLLSRDTIERAAKVCEDVCWRDQGLDGSFRNGAHACADAIRALKEGA